MNISEPVLQSVSESSVEARNRILVRRGEPLFYADWERVLMIHFEVDAAALQRDVPYELDLCDERAYVSLVAFTMRGMRPRAGGRPAAWLLRPIATHEFLNVRTYVRHGGETGIHFIAEWLSNWLAVRLGPATFGLPYHYGQVTYDLNWRAGELHGRVTDAASHATLSYRARLTSPVRFEPCESGSLTAWLMERYTAFTCHRNRRRFFRVWHPPWQQCEVDVVLSDLSLVNHYWPWFRHARSTGANFSPGLRDVWMGRTFRADTTAIFSHTNHEVLGHSLTLPESIGTVHPQ